MTTLNEFGLSDWTMNDLRSVFRRHPKVRKVILFITTSTTSDCSTRWICCTMRRSGERP
ncbi:hypothetical protein [uncultured Prevotella sp.]|uniref:hypothetical protein n=1 Tax=uncultured Prevotella sp. TaxID=159272 RepID=UPI00338D8BC9